MENVDKLTELEALLQVTFRDRSLLQRAITHHSCCPETAVRDSYDTLEFLGDAMERLVTVVQELSLARDVATVLAIVCHAAHVLTGADGASFVLREGDIAATPKFEAKRRGASDHSDNCMVVASGGYYASNFAGSALTPARR